MKKTFVELIDDIDGSIAAKTVSFAFKGVSYEIDLSEEHIEELTEVMSPWIQAARRTSSRNTGRKSRSTKATEVAKIRDWAQENGIKISGRGRIPVSVVEQYRASQG